MLYRLAETGMFDQLGSKKTRLQCAGEADLYEAFHYLARCNALEKLNEK